MGKLYFCIGKKADRPYRIRPLNTPVYTIEELCFYICENAQMLDKDFMTQQLVNFIADDFDLKPLAQKLLQLLHFGGSLHAFCGLILEETDYRSAEEIKEIEEILKTNEAMTTVMRLENQAEHMLAKKEYYKALKAYGILLLQTSEEPQKRAEYLFGMGQAAAELFYYELALEYFTKSNQLLPSRKTQERMLLCRRLYMSHTQYIRYTTDHEECYELALEIEKKYESAKSEAQKQSMGLCVDSQQLKEQYRQMMME